MIISREALTPLPALDKGKFCVGLAEFWRINSVFWNRFFWVFFITTSYIIFSRHLIFLIFINVDWTMLLIILIIRIIVIFIPITKESSPNFFEVLSKWAGWSSTSSLFFNTCIIINRKSPHRWSLYLSLALCVDHLVSASFQQRDGYSSELHHWHVHLKLTTSMICWRVRPKVSTTASDSFATGLSNYLRWGVNSKVFKSLQSIQKQWV